MPSFTELYYSVGGHKADRHLKPEELSAVEGGLRYTSRTIEAKASVFYNRHRNLIDWISDGETDETGGTSTSATSRPSACRPRYRRT